MWNITLACVSLLFFCVFNSYANAGADAILGQWVSEQGNVKVEVYKEGEEYKARVIWFDDTDDESRPMSSRTDEKNPDSGLRSRKILGMQVLSGLRYNAKKNHWEHGLIYDSRTGKEWSSVVTLSKNGRLNVKGYWHFEFLGKTMSFKRPEVKGLPLTAK